MVSEHQQLQEHTPPHSLAPTVTPGLLSVTVWVSAATPPRALAMVPRVPPGLPTSQRQARELPRLPAGPLAPAHLGKGSPGSLGRRDGRLAPATCLTPTLSGFWVRSASRSFADAILGISARPRDAERKDAGIPGPLGSVPSAC